MPKLSRRTALTHGGQVVAAAAVLTALPSIVHAKEDAALLDLERQWDLAVARYRKCREAKWKAVDDLPPSQRWIPDTPFLRETPHVKELINLEDRAERDMRVIEDRMTETPAQTIHGVAAKLRVGQGPVMMQAFRDSIVADAERLAGGVV